MTLQTVVPNSIWHAEQSIKFGPLSIITRSTFVKLSDGSIWVHSPIKPTVDLLNQLKAIGEVRHIIAPNKSHHLFFLDFINKFPEAKGYVTEGLELKRPDLEKYTKLTESIAQSWSPDLTGFHVKGIPTLNETIWFHTKTGTLIVTDLLFNFGKSTNILSRFIASVLGVNKKMRMSRTMKLLVKDNKQLNQVVSEIKKLDIKRVILAHDTIVEQNAKTELIQAFNWLNE